ncbi:hypothetical protein PAERUG_P45_London_17_VIM_2_12_12_02414 [Pseudomonas aeruginosa]|nr:hypothetical protein PAERUG_P45_London_17_VIM_2_12_12_02414 [Pseudomonas aeruginosa]
MLRHQATDDGVAGFVVGGVALLLLGHDHGLALGAHHDLVLGQLELAHVDDALVGARGEQRSLVDQVGQVGAGETGRTAGDDGRIDMVAQRHLAHVHLEDLFAPADIRQADHHLAVEAARTQQRRVQNVRTVGGSDDDDAIVHLEAIHLYQQLVEGLLALVVTTAQAGAAMAADGVDLVDEDDARRMLLGLVEHVADTGSAHADEHLDEVGTGNGEERHLGFAGDGLGQQGLAGAGRADHQHAARDTAAQALELARIAKELDQLADLLLGLVAAGDVSEGGLDLVLGQQARLALAEAHRAAATAAATLHLAHEEHEDGDDHQDREAGDQQLGPDALLFGLLALDHDVVVDQVADQAVVLDRRADGLEGIAVATLAGDDIAIHGHSLDLAILDLLDEVRVVQRLWLARAREIVHHGHQYRRDDQPQNQILCHVVQLTTL